jgi:hypothetical protein
MSGYTMDYISTSIERSVYSTNSSTEREREREREKPTISMLTVHTDHYYSLVGEVGRGGERHTPWRKQQQIIIMASFIAEGGHEF